jgi:hypothetical protein
MGLLNKNQTSMQALPGTSPSVVGNKDGARQGVVTAKEKGRSKNKKTTSPLRMVGPNQNAAYQDQIASSNNAYSQAMSMGGGTLNANRQGESTKIQNQIINISSGTTAFGAFGHSQSKNQINIIAKKRPPSMPLKNGEIKGIDPKRKVLYRNFHDIGGTVYLIEISRNALKVFILLFPNFEVPEIYLCEVMAEKKAQKLMTESSNMFEELIKKFHIKYGKLQI